MILQIQTYLHTRNKNTKKKMQQKKSQKGILVAKFSIVLRLYTTTTELYNVYIHIHKYCIIISSYYLFISFPSFLRSFLLLLFLLL